MKKEILEIIEWYGTKVDPQGWEISERFEAVQKILDLMEKFRKTNLTQ
ncbi:MAG: hypothetical protein ABIH76_00805 [Candidatus Bathyarchaeota archaeon]